MATWKVLLGPSAFAERDRSPLDRLEHSGYTIINNPFRRKLTRSEIQELLQPDVVGLLAGLEPLDHDTLSRSRLKVISRVGSGMSNVDVEAAQALGIQVYSTPNGPTRAVAELTLSALLNLLRFLPQMNTSLHNGKWDKRIGQEIYGKKVVIVGLGRIGRALAELLLACGAEVIGVDPHPSHIPPAVTMKSLPDALAVADVVTLHSSGEEKILGAAEFMALKNGVFILNAARGTLIDEKELIQALDSGKVAGAWLDAFSEEPYRGPLCGYGQVLLTPHVGSYTQECRRMMEMEAVDNLLKGLLLAGVADPAVSQVER